MQKTGQNASILIWAIFLSLIISLWFISISTNINKTIKNNIALQKNINASSQQDNILSNENSTSGYLSNGSYLKIEDKNYYSSSLKINEEKSFSFSGTTLDFVTIDIIQWWPIKFEYSIPSISYLTGGVVQNNLSFSWTLNNINTQSSLKIKNLWWYTLFQILSDLDFKKPEQKYQIWKKIWNKNVLIQSSEVK